VTARDHLTVIIRAAIAAVDPARLVAAALNKEGKSGGHETRFQIVCAGKAAVAMARGALQAMGERIAGGVIVSPDSGPDIPPFERMTGAHPLPTGASERAGRRALAIADAVRNDERLLCLLSGGASALMAVPAAGLSLADKVETTNRLLRAGADITTLNAVRKHLSEIKGGGLARRSPSGCHTLAISDVVGDELAVIGSGPGVPDPSRFGDALEALQTFGGIDTYPAAVVSRLEAGVRGEIAETLKPADPQASRATAAVIGSRVEAMDGACAAARRLGYQTVRIDSAVVGEARAAAIEHLRAIERRGGIEAGRVCFVSSGETTVRVTGGGSGGRNQEFVLAAVRTLARLGPEVALASAGTDGIDGPTIAAGAVADGGTLARALAAGLDPDTFLAANDSHTFFDTLGDVLVTGPTGTNVGDIQVVLLNRSAATGSRLR
jgi:glycerate 2-kinase